MRSPITVIVRSASASTWTNPRRWAPGRHAAATRTPSDSRRRFASRPRSSPPRAVMNRHSPASRASCTAATAPPPPTSSKPSSAWTISPGAGTCSTRTNSTHSTCPTTANRIEPDTVSRACPARSSARKAQPGVAPGRELALDHPALEGPEASRRPRVEHAQPPARHAAEVAAAERGGGSSGRPASPRRSSAAARAPSPGRRIRRRR